MTITINKIWDDLLRDDSVSRGHLFRRYSGTISPDIFIGMQLPEKLYCIGASVSSDININMSSFANLQEIQIELLSDLNKDGRNMLLIKLINNQHKDIFSLLCEDLIQSVAEESNENRLVKILLNRFEKWRTLFDNASQSGLSPEDQRGLFGELLFLRKLLNRSEDHFRIMSCWTGPSKEIRDFQNVDWAVEVKTTIANNHQKIHISSERQLDITNLETLYLYHVSLEKMNDSGETLPGLINDINLILKNDTLSLNRFKAKLYEVGCFDHHMDLYAHTGYHLRNQSFYEVTGDFPRLQEDDLRPGVGDVKYSIILSQCQQYLLDESEVLSNLKI